MASSVFRSFSVLTALGLVTVLGSARCAKGDCGVNSDCGPRRYCEIETQQCRSDCVEDRDCTEGFCDLNGRCQSGVRPDSGVVDTDAGEDVVSAIDTGPEVFVRPDVSPPIDTGPEVFVRPDVSPPIDTGPIDTGPIDTGPIDTGPIDTGPIDTGPVDTGPIPGRGQYLDRCTNNSDCASSNCALTDGGGFCSRACTRNADCGDGMICNSPPPGSPAHCVFDDIGRACNPSTPTQCARYCFGTATAAHCTRECTNGSDCPGGFGCQSAQTTSGSTISVCIEIEKPCTSADDCPGGICLSIGTFRGCSAPCRNQADCPARMTIPDDLGNPVQLPRYSCGMVGSVRACIPPLPTGSPPGDILGSDPLGVACSATGAPTCYSGVCISDDVTAATACVQRCTPSSGCPDGFACRPIPDVLPPVLACQAGIGRGLFGAACTRGADCATGLCFPESSGSGAFCTRYCNDTLCPTGMHCMVSGRTVDGLPISLCLR